ncbi:MAG TPA: hypothetical protein VL990_01385 [Acidobacteriaceae bacterium]|nr:hypothetical protein [Acidobacteriaceae bacterium]
MARSVPFTGEHLARFLAGQKRWNDAREWRARQTEAGRPSTWLDFCRSHGICAACAAAGVALNGNGVGFKTLGWSANLPLYEECTACGGTGKVVTPS